MLSTFHSTAHTLWERVGRKQHSLWQLQNKLQDTHKDTLFFLLVPLQSNYQMTILTKKQCANVFNIKKKKSQNFYIMLMHLN